MPTIQLNLYSRSYCHLCEQMRQALQSLDLAVPFELQVVDVDTDPALVTKFDELVPVLAAQMADGQELLLCHYFLDETKVRDFFTRHSSSTSV